MVGPNRKFGDIAQLVEHDPFKVVAAGSIPAVPNN